MHMSYLKTNLLGAALFGTGALSGCAYCACLLVGILGWLALSGLYQVHTTLETV